MRTLILIIPLLFLIGCASTSSVLVDHDVLKPSTVAIIPLQGEYGQQAADLIAEQLALKGIPIIERSQLDVVLKEHGCRDNEKFDQTSLAEYGRLLGVKKIFAGTITAVRGPLSSFPHVNITLKVVDIATGKVTWIGRYGNSLWTSAISTQGDIQRGAKYIVEEFVKVHGTNF